MSARRALVRRRTTRFTVALAAAAAVACGGDAPSAPPSVSLVFSSTGGRTERGDTVRAVLLTGASSLSEPAATVSVQPADGATVLPGGVLVLRRAVRLTVDATAATGATASAALTVASPPTLLFDAEVAGNRDVYRAALDGGDLARLTTDPLDDEHPTAANGTVLFTSYRDGQAALYSSGSATVADHRLAAAPAGASAPSLSADGHRVAFVREQAGVDRVWVAAADGTGAALLTTGAGGQPEGSPVWSPDGRITFTSTATGQADLVSAVDAPPAVPVSIAAANTSAAEVEGAWSADGRRLAFVSTRAGGAALYVLTVSTGAVVRVSPAGESGGQPSWLADGRIVYVAVRGGSSVLRWLDPSSGESRDVPAPGTSPQHPVESR